MTQLARNGYRKHRKPTWGLAMLLALAVGAIIIPLASGGGGKTYTFGVTPTSFCVGTTNSSTVTITNTSRTQSLGSAELFFPAGSIASAKQGTTSLPLTTSADGSPYYSGTWDIVGPLNSLGLSNGQSTLLNVTYTAGVHSGPIQAVVKQANQFNDNSGGTANVFDNPSTWPQLNIATCHYVFTRQPANAQTGSAQTVKVQLQSGGSAVAVSDGLSLHAYETGTTGNVDGNFTGLSSTGQSTGQDANTWVFSVTGNVHGDGYTLVAGSDSSNSFNINDCNPVNGTCSTPLVINGDGDGGYQVSGTGLSSGFDVSPLSSTGLTTAEVGICNTGWGWREMTFQAQPPDGRTTFDGITTSTTTYSSQSGAMLVTLYLRNDLYVQTSASQTNSIQLCAGAMHTFTDTDHGGWANGPAQNAWTGANGVLAKFDTDSGLYWGVLQRIPNCNSNKIPVNNGIKSPALCAWGTQTIGGVDYRTATMIVPYDWDFSPKP